MRTELWDYLFDEGFLPHGTCLLWNPTLFWTHAVSDAVIALSYFSIPIVLAAFVLRRRDFQYRWVVSLFGVFIVLCGLSHIFGIWTLWVPSYAAEGAVKALTAVVSAITAVLLWPLLPKVVAIPSFADLERQNHLLELEVRRHRETQAKLSRLNGELEDRVRERTADLESKTLQLEGLTHAAEAANDAKSRFLSMVSHEIRTPLNSVISMSSLLLGKIGDRTDRRYVGTISSASKALLAIVQDILEFSQLEAGQISLSSSSTDIEEVVEDVVETVASQAHQRGLDIAAYIAPSVPRAVVTDGGRIRQILLILIGNAVNYTSEGSVQVRVGWQGDAHQGTLAVDVIDTGIGIAPQDQEVIFDRFSQVETERPGAVRGTGLGLSICRRLVIEMGGRISVESAPGKGSTFSLRLHVDRAEGPRPGARAVEAVVFAGAETTAKLIAETFADSGGKTEIVPFGPTESPGPIIRKDVAIVLAPVELRDPAECLMVCRLARRWANQVVLYIPIGASEELRVGAAEAGLSAQTYPIRRRELDSQSTLNGLSGKEADLSVPDLRGLSILVVDDNDENLFVADHVLSHAGATVRCVDSGEAALTALTHAAFDCVLLDLRMPGLDGFQTAQRIRDSGPTGKDTIIIAVSANLEPAILGRLAALNVTDQLAKPYMPLDLWTVVQRAIGRVPSTEAMMPTETPSLTQPAEELTLDHSVIEQLVEFAGTGLVLDGIDQFLAGLSECLARIAEETLTRSQRAGEAHKLAGSAGSLGLLALSAECRTLEDQLRQEPPPPSGIATTGFLHIADAAREAMIRARNRLDKPDEQTSQR